MTQMMNFVGRFQKKVRARNVILYPHHDKRIDDWEIPNSNQPILTIERSCYTGVAETNRSSFSNAAVNPTEMISRKSISGISGKPV